MAGAWVKMRTGIGRDPKVIAMADYLASRREFIDSVCDPVRLSCKATCYECVTRDVLRSATVALLIEVWGVTRELGKAKDMDVILDHCTLEAIDAIAGKPCFGAAMAHVGWAVEESDGRGNTWVRFPKFLLNNVPAEDRSREMHADRQRRYRERRRHDETPCVAPPVAPPVAPRSDDRGEKRREENTEEENPLTPFQGEPPRLTPAEFLSAWNAQGGLTPCRLMTARRQKHLRARSADPAWLDSWREALARAAASPFCRGGNDRGWRATVDWFLRPDTVARLLEGAYDGRANGAGANGPLDGFLRGFLGAGAGVNEEGDS